MSSGIAEARTEGAPGAPAVPSAAPALPRDGPDAPSGLARIAALPAARPWHLAVAALAAGLALAGGPPAWLARRGCGGLRAARRVSRRRPRRAVCGACARPAPRSATSGLMRSIVRRHSSQTAVPSSSGATCSRLLGRRPSALPSRSGCRRGACGQAVSWSGCRAGRGCPRARAWATSCSFAAGSGSRARRPTALSISPPTFGAVGSRASCCSTGPERAAAAAAESRACSTACARVRSGPWRRGSHLPRPPSNAGWCSGRTRRSPWRCARTSATAGWLICSP